MDKTVNKYRIHLICILLVVITFIAFEPIIHNRFITFDDDIYIYNNSHITSGLTLKNIVWSFTNIHANNYHPLTSLSHMLDCQLYGTNPAGHHLTNLLFHIGSTLLLFTALRSMTKMTWASAFAAALFALHPLHVESVAWASERKDTLSTFFWMLTMLAYIWYVKKPDTSRYLLMLILFMLGLLSKPMIVSLPFVLFLLDYWPLNRFGNNRLSRLIFEKIPFLVLSVIWGVITFMVQLKTGMVKTISSYPLSWRIGNALISYVIYIEKTFWPAKLAIFYPHPEGNIPLWQITGAALILGIATFLALRTLRQRPYIAVGWLWFLVTLAPVIGIFQVGLQGRADRYMYIPSIGLFITITWYINEFLSRLRWRKVFISLSAAVLLSAVGAKTYIQTLYWNNSTLLYKHTIDVVENVWWVHHFLGTVFASQGKLEEAIAQYKEALQVDPRNANIHYALAKTLFNNGDVNEAIKSYQQLFSLLPEDLNEPPGADTSQDNYLSLRKLYVNANIGYAVALARQGDTAGAARHFKKALRVAPDAQAARKGLEDMEKQSAAP